MQQLENLIRLMVEELVDTPKEICVSLEEDDDKAVFTVAVGFGEAGQVIGRYGRVANSIRTVIKASARKRGLKPVYLNIRA